MVFTFANEKKNRKNCYFGRIFGGMEIEEDEYEGVKGREEEKTEVLELWE
jgi:hypothetical protein